MQVAEMRWWMLLCQARRLNGVGMPFNSYRGILVHMDEIGRPTDMYSRVSSCSIEDSHSHGHHDGLQNYSIEQNNTLVGRAAFSLHRRNNVYFD
jgi:hypothetical protein